MKELVDGSTDFNMSKTQGEILLSMLCEETEFEIVDGAFSKGKNCGKLFDEKYDIQISNFNKSWWFGENYKSYKFRNLIIIKHFMKTFLIITKIDGV